MNGSTIPQSVFSSIEKVLRYLIPGLLFVVLLKASFLPDKVLGLRIGLTGEEVYLLSPVFGFVVYTIHRVLFWFPDVACRKYLEVTLTKSLLGQATRKKQYPELAEILYYRWAIIHFALILSELTITFSFLSEPGTVVSRCWPYLPIGAGVFFVICVGFYIRLDLADLKLIDRINKDNSC